MDDEIMEWPAEGTEQPRAEETGADEATKSLVSTWCKRVKGAKAKHADAFERMRDDMRFARGLQWADQKDLKDPRYTANIVQRHLRQREAALYARNPKAVAHRRSTLDFRVWDGEPQSLMQAQQTLVMAQQAMQQATAMGDAAMAQQAMQQAQQAQELLQDYQQGMQRRQMLDN